MIKPILFAVFGLAIAVFGNRPAIVVSAEPPSVESFTLDELFERGGGGCGMVLWKASGTYEDGFIFFNGILESTALMKVDDEFVNLRRIEAEGEDFYGQKNRQVFVSSDETIRVETEVELGEPGEIESVGISSGTLRISRDGQTSDIPVAGDAGC